MKAKRNPKQGEGFLLASVLAVGFNWQSIVVVIAISTTDISGLIHSFLSREIVLGRLASLIKKFVAKVSIARGLSEAAANTAGGKIFTFGSYRLGVHGPGSDIDTLCVVPKHISREDFFETLEPMLKETEGVTEVSVCIPLSLLKIFVNVILYRAYLMHMCLY